MTEIQHEVLRENFRPTLDNDASTLACIDNKMVKIRMNGRVQKDTYL